eukprot:jgi/Galph1/5112/GphlegSOOS_G3783.1
MTDMVIGWQIPVQLSTTQNTSLFVHKKAQLLDTAPQVFAERQAVSLHWQKPLLHFHQRRTGVSLHKHRKTVHLIQQDSTSCCAQNKVAKVSTRKVETKEGKSSLTVVLFQPRIPGNTGNIGRTCLAFGARLHLIGPLGFSIDEHAVRRAGLDYWKHVDLEYSESWEAFEKASKVVGDNCHFYFFTKCGEHVLGNVTFSKVGHVLLIFGSETEGFQQLPAHAQSKGVSVRIPMQNTDIIRSYNLSNSVAIALWEYWICSSDPISIDLDPHVPHVCAMKNKILHRARAVISEGAYHRVERNS